MRKKRTIKVWFMQNRLNILCVLILWAGLSALIYKLTNPTIVEADVVEPAVVEEAIYIPMPEEYEARPVIVEDLPFTREEVMLLAMLLEAECLDRNTDWHKEASVVANRLAVREGTLLNPDGTITGIIMSGNGSQFNGVRTEGFKNGEYTGKAFNAAWNVLINGYRAFDGDESILYFTNVDYAYAHPEDHDLEFIESIDWVYAQANGKQNSFGRAK